MADSYVKAGKIDSIRFSTRPDTVNRETLELISAFPVTHVELGVQSMDDSVLLASLRGHTAKDAATAALSVKEKGYSLGLQMMTGLPGDSGGQSLETAKRIADLAPDFVRVYPTVVLKDSPLAGMWRDGLYEAQDIDAAVDLAKDISRIFAAENIPVIRMGLAPSESLEGGVILAGPYHPAFGHLVESAVFLDKAMALLEESGINKGRAAFRINPKSESRLRGHKNSNMEILSRRLGMVPAVIHDSELTPEQIYLG